MTSSVQPLQNIALGMKHQVRSKRVQMFNRNIGKTLNISHLLNIFKIELTSKNFVSPVSPCIKERDPTLRKVNNNFLSPFPCHFGNFHFAPLPILECFFSAAEINASNFLSFSLSTIIFQLSLALSLSLSLSLSLLSLKHNKIPFSQTLN